MKEGNHSQRVLQMIAFVINAIMAVHTSPAVMRSKCTSRMKDIPALPVNPHHTTYDKTCRGDW